MGTKFFASKPASMQPTNMNMESRNLNAGQYAGRVAGGAAQKDIGAALALYKAHQAKPMKGTAAYAPGPKKV